MRFMPREGVSKTEKSQRGRGEDGEKTEWEGGGEGRREKERGRSERERRLAASKSEDEMQSVALVDAVVADRVRIGHGLALVDETLLVLRDA